MAKFGPFEGQTRVEMNVFQIKPTEFLLFGRIVGQKRGQFEIRV